MANAGTGVVVAGAAAGVAITADVGWMYTYSVVSVPDDEWSTPDQTVGVRKLAVPAAGAM